MEPPTYYTETGLTGRVRGRLAWSGRVVMQVEVGVEAMKMFQVLNRFTKWRDVRPNDLIQHAGSLTLAQQ